MFCLSTKLITFDPYMLPSVSTTGERVCYVASAIQNCYLLMIHGKCRYNAACVGCEWNYCDMRKFHYAVVATSWLIYEIFIVSGESLHDDWFRFDKAVNVYKRSHMR